MFVGVLRLHLRIVDARSLKDKRRVVKSLKERLMSRLRVSAAEVGELDHPQHATIAVAVVANEAAHCDSVLAEAAATASNLPDAILTDRATEIVSFGRGGSGIESNLGRALDGDMLGGDMSSGGATSEGDDEYR